MTIDFQSFLDSVKMFHIVVLSTLTGYLLAAPATLRVWIATQKATSFPSQEDEIITWKHWALVCGIVLPLLVLEYILFFHATPQVFNNVVCALVGCAVFVSCKALFSNLTGIIKRGVHRSNQGVPVQTAVRQKRNWRQKSTLLAGLLGSIAISVGALMTNHQALVAVASTALVYNLSRHSNFKSISMRWMIIGLLGLIAGSLLLCASLAVFSGSKERTGDDTDLKINTLDDVWFHERSWVLATTYAFVPGMFIAFCLRFDYQRHLDNTATAASEFILCKVSAPESKMGTKQKLGEGVVVPSHAPTAFYKVYYTTALVAWGITQLGMVCVHAFMRLPPGLESALDFRIVALFPELPVMSFAIIAVAVVRGECKAMWRYKEIWVIKPEAKKPASDEATIFAPKEEKEVEP